MERFKKTEYIQQLMDCYKTGKGIRHFNDFLIFTEISPADSERYNLFIWRKSGSYTPIIHFYDLKINDNDEIEKIYNKINKEVNPRETLEDIIKKFDRKEITFKEYNDFVLEEKAR